MICAVNGKGLLVLAEVFPMIVSLTVMANWPGRLSEEVRFSLEVIDVLDFDALMLQWTPGHIPQLISPILICTNFASIFFQDARSTSSQNLVKLSFQVSSGS